MAHPSILLSLSCLLAGICLIVILTARFKIHAFFALLLACLVVGTGVGLAPLDLIKTMKDGFANTMGSLGFIIILGTTLGVLLERSGSTGIMANYILGKVGETRAPMAVSITGFIVGLPIFCDSAFIMLSGLNQSLAFRARIPLSVMAVSMATGLLAVHCLIPPHPGATTAATIIGIGYGRLMVAGIGVAIPSTFIGYLWARYAGKRFPESPDQEETLMNFAVADEGASTGNLGVWMAFLPVIVPILLITLRSLLTILPIPGGPWSAFAQVTGDPVVALSAGVLLAFWGGRRQLKNGLPHLLHDAIEKAGSILIIIGAGGAFGAVLAATHIGEQMSLVLPLASMGILFPFLLTTALKTALGSSTIAIITAASVIKPVLAVLGLASGNGPLICVLAMGSGSMLLSHANDAYFWVISRFTGLSMKTMLRVYTPASALMGVTAFFVVYLISRFLS